VGGVTTSEPYRVLFVCSSGGHLAQLMQLESWWRDLERSWVCVRTADAEEHLADERVDWAYAPTTRNVRNLVRNLFLARRVLRRERPDVIVSTGAGSAVPFFWLGYRRRIPTVYLEVYDRVSSRTLSGRLCKPFSDVFLLQWESQRRVYGDGIVVGPVY
jgi:UDP-N-acetylglucosamine:LPS N-acetylglucosamine transferase